MIQSYCPERWTWKSWKHHLFSVRNTQKPLSIICINGVASKSEVISKRNHQVPWRPIIHCCPLEPVWNIENTVSHVVQKRMDKFSRPLTALQLRFPQKLMSIRMQKFTPIFRWSRIPKFIPTMILPLLEFQLNSIRATATLTSQPHHHHHSPHFQLSWSNIIVLNIP